MDAKAFFEYLGRLELEGDLDLFERYLETLESFLDIEAKKHQEQHSKKKHERLRELREDMVAAGETDPLMFDSFFPTPEEDFHYSELRELDYFANILRKSFFLSLYAFLESRLNALCRSRRKDDNLLSLEDIRGTGIIRAKTYWVKELRLGFPSGSQWKEIRDGYRILRNCIVHNEGRLNKEMERGKAKLEEFVAHKQSLSLSGEEIVLRKSFCKEALDVIRDFFNSLPA